MDDKTLLTALDAVESLLNNQRVLHSCQVGWKKRGSWGHEGTEKRLARLKRERRYISAIKKLRAHLGERHPEVNKIAIEEIGTKVYWDRNKTPHESI